MRISTQSSHFDARTGVVSKTGVGMQGRKHVATNAEMKRGSCLKKLKMW